MIPFNSECCLRFVFLRAEAAEQQISNSFYCAAAAAVRLCQDVAEIIFQKSCFQFTECLVTEAEMSDATDFNVRLFKHLK